MDFNLPEELQVLKDTVRKFVDRELIPLERECRPEGEDMPEQYIKPLQEKAKAIGLWLLDVPQEYGGAGPRSDEPLRDHGRSRAYGGDSVSLCADLRAGSAAGAVSLQRRTEDSAFSCR